MTKNDVVVVERGRAIGCRLLDCELLFSWRSHGAIQLLLFPRFLTRQSGDSHRMQGFQDFPVICIRAGFHSSPFVAPHTLHSLKDSSTSSTSLSSAQISFPYFKHLVVYSKRFTLTTRKNYKSNKKKVYVPSNAANTHTSPFDSTRLRRKKIFYDPHSLPSPFTFKNKN